MLETLLMLVAAPLAPASPYCALEVRQIVPPPLLPQGLAAKFELRPVPSCKSGQITRARKRSLLNAEAPYKPIFPLKGAWEIKAGETRNEWKGRHWQFEYWTGKTWAAAKDVS